MDDLISRQAALDALGEAPEVWTDSPEEFAALNQWEMDVTAIEAVPSAEPKTGRDCTEFMEWLKAEVLDEENWDLNAVANGEIICRKFKKMGWLNTEGGYYVDKRPKTGHWIIEEADSIYGKKYILTCSECGEKVSVTETSLPHEKYCRECGAKMLGEDGEA